MPVNYVVCCGVDVVAKQVCWVIWFGWHAFFLLSVTSLVSLHPLNVIMVDMLLFQSGCKFSIPTCCVCESWVPNRRWKLWWAELLLFMKPKSISRFGVHYLICWCDQRFIYIIHISSIIKIWPPGSWLHGLSFFSLSLCGTTFVAKHCCVFPCELWFQCCFFTWSSDKPIEFDWMISTWHA